MALPDERSAHERLAVLEGGGPTTDELVSIVRDGQSVVGESSIDGGHRIDFEARNIRRERTGTHARVALTCANAALAWNVFNIERDEDRTRLANSAAKRLGDAKKYGEPLKKRLDEFCEGVWPAWVKADEGSEVIPREDGQPTWQLEPYIVEGGGTILYGPPGSTKSWLSLIWSACLTDCPGSSPWPLVESPVLFVNLERSAKSIGWRVARVAEVMECRPRIFALNARGRTLHDVWDAAEATVKREKIGIVIVDSLSRAGAGDLTNNEPANRAMDALNALCETWMVIAHTPRSDGSHVFGSVMLEAAADLCIRLSSETSPVNDSVVGVKLDVTKANDMKKARSVTWAMEFDDRGLAAFRRPSSYEFPDLEAPQSLGEQISDYLKAAGKASGSEMANELGADRSSVASALQRDRRFVRLGKEGRTVLYGLQAQGL